MATEAAEDDEDDDDEDDDDDDDDVDLGDLSGLIRASCLFINPPVKAILPKLLHQATNSGKS